MLAGGLPMTPSVALSAGSPGSSSAVRSVVAGVVMVGRGKCMTLSVLSVARSARCLLSLEKGDPCIVVSATLKLGIAILFRIVSTNEEGIAYVTPPLFLSA